MRLLLSSDALPGATLGTLTQACTRRALSGLELTLQRDQGHGLDESICPVRQQNGHACIPDQPEAPVVWLRVVDRPTFSMLALWTAEAHLAGAGILLSEPVQELPLASRFALVHGTDPVEARAAVAWAERHHARTCWQIGPERNDLAAVDEVLRITSGTLAHVRLLGAGPEAGSGSDQPSGTGMLLGRLALNCYDGTVALAPYSEARLPEWEQWLVSGRGWGCGTAAEKQARANGQLVQINLTQIAHP